MADGVRGWANGFSLLPFGVGVKVFVFRKNSFEEIPITEVHTVCWRWKNRINFLLITLDINV